MTEPGTEREGPAGAGRPVGDLTYAEASQELDGIVAYFEQREVDVDHLVARLERATAIVGELDQRLRKTRVQVEQLVPKLAAVLSDDGAGAGGTDGTSAGGTAVDGDATDDQVTTDGTPAEDDAIAAGEDDQGDPGGDEPPGLF
ncbi:MAG: exodeoxyribonuclease VII small subunit [Acidimicrobiales bacterium]